MIRIYLKLPYFMQFVIINIAGLVKQVIRKSFGYRTSLEYYRSFYRGEVGYLKEYEKRVSEFSSYKNEILKALQNLDTQDLDKEYVKKNIANFYKFSPRLTLSAKTSGSTGSGLRFRKTFLSESDTWAAYVAFREYHGVTAKDWCGYFCGNKIVSPSGRKISHISYTSRQIIFSQYNLKHSNVSCYIDELNYRRPPWLHGYPSFLLELAGLAKEQGIGLAYSPALLTTGSENLSKRQKAILSDFFNCPVRDLYCQTEMVAMLYECSHGKMHVNEAYSKVDFRLIEDANMYEIVGTNLNNSAFPLFNYRTSDLVSLASNQIHQECSCGNRSRIVDRIEGRNEDSLLLPTGVRIGRLDHVLKGFEGVSQAQFIQDPETFDTALLIAVPRGFSGIDELRKKLCLYLPGLDVKIKTVDKIKRERNGKIKFVKSIKGFKSSLDV